MAPKGQRDGYEESMPLTEGKDSVEGRAILKSNQTFVYATTFIAYAMSHFSRKCYTNVKVQLNTSAGVDKTVLSSMDTAFMTCYALGSFCSGSLGDRFHPPTIIGIGLLGSAACVMSLVYAAVWFDIMAVYPAVGAGSFIFIWMCHGFFQSTGGPVGTAIMGNWFGPKNRGLVFGTWTCHQYTGNILAALVAAAVLHTQALGYEWALIIPAICNFIWGVVCWNLLPARPADVEDCPQPEGLEIKKSANPTNDAKQPPPISFIDAFKIPSVAGYALAFGFFKLVNYVIFFWLPFFLNTAFDSGTANIVSSLYDVGMMPGGIIVGYVSDLYGGRRACVIVSFLTALCPLLWLFAMYSDVMPTYVLMPLLIVMGCLVGGPNNIITSAVSADLASHPSIQGNNRALGTVTGIINGSGSITAALGMSIVGPLQEAAGWASVWYFLIIVTLLGCLILMPRVLKEIYDHDDHVSAKPAAAAPSGKDHGYQSIDRRA